MTDKDTVELLRKAINNYDDGLITKEQLDDRLFTIAYSTVDSTNSLSTVLMERKHLMLSMEQNAPPGKSDSYQ